VAKFAENVLDLREKRFHFFLDVLEAFGGVFWRDRHGSLFLVVVRVGGFRRPATCTCKPWFSKRIQPCLARIWKVLGMFFDAQSMLGVGAGNAVRRSFRNGERVAHVARCRVRSDVLGDGPNERTPALWRAFWAMGGGWL